RPGGERDRPRLGAAAHACHRAGGVTPPESDVGDVRARFPRVCAPPRRARLLRWLGVLAFVAWLVALGVWFDIPPARLARGLSGLLVILRQMVPPSPGAQWRDILQGLAESVAM